jgi:hypothetical protein
MTRPAFNQDVRRAHTRMHTMLAHWAGICIPFGHNLSLAHDFWKLWQNMHIHDSVYKK